MTVPLLTTVRRTTALAGGLPPFLRWALVASSLIPVFWLSLSPSDAVPTVSLSDKIQHGSAFAALTLAYGLLFPCRRVAVILGVAALGLAIEVLQAVMPFGRRAEFGDLVADAAGVVTGLLLLRLLAGPAKLPT
jgi:VanZ family protein